MKIAVTQTQPVIGDVRTNIQNHLDIARVAVSHKVDALIFSELSLTGYEPELARELAIVKEDSRLDAFQALSDQVQITLGVGAPTRHAAGICISLILFRPNRPRALYSKRYLHADEEPYFISGKGISELTSIGDDPVVALAICYELSVPEHAEQALCCGAGLYVASVAKVERGMEAALARLSEIAKTYTVKVMVANCIGLADGAMCAGKSAVFDAQGRQVAQLGGDTTGLLILDTAGGVESLTL